MKEIRAKLLDGMKTVFGWGILTALLVGGLSFFGYLAALIIGGETAAAICSFIYKKVYPVLVILSTSMILLGLIRMYLAGDTAMSVKKKQKE